MVIENPKGGIAGNSNFLRKLRRGAGGRGGGGIAKVIQSYWGDQHSEVTFKGGIG